MGRAPRSDFTTDEARFRRRCQALLSTAVTLNRKSQSELPSVEQVVEAIETSRDQGVALEYLTDAMSGKHWPAAPKAWKIGEALRVCGASAWSGLAMLYVAGRYEDYVGTSVLLAWHSLAEPADYDVVKSYIRSVPALFGSFLVQERFLINESGDGWTNEDEESALDRLADRALESRWSAKFELNGERLRQSWRDWSDVRGGQSRLAVRASAIEMARGLRMELREREIETYLEDMLDDPQRLEKQIPRQL